MKRICFVLIVLATAVYCLPSFAGAAGDNYVTLKPGIYMPESSGLRHFDAGFNGEIAFGHRFNRNLALELGIGRFTTDARFRDAERVPGIQYPYRERDYLEVVPLTLTLKVIKPVGRWELFGLGGIGAYIMSEEIRVTGTVDGWSGRASFEDSTTALGAHLGIGFHYNITPALFVGTEGRYVWVKQVGLRDEIPGLPIAMDSKFRADGITATAVLGFRF